MKKMLTLDDLVKVCKEQKLIKFNSKEVGYPLHVQIPAKFEIDDEESSSTLYANVQVMHTGRNRNGSNLIESAAKECIKNMAYKPLLANFCEIDGVRDFTSHDFTINEEGEVEYQERQIGCITADKAYLEDDAKVEGRKNIFARVAIPREYTDAAEIIERKGGTKVSAELEIFAMSYDVKEKELLLEEVELIGLTCLGTDPETGEEVQEGMEGSHIQLEDFSANSNPYKYYAMSEEIKKFIQDSINEVLSDKNIQGKEENSMEFEEMTEVTETEETVTEEFTEAEATEDESTETATEESTEEEVTVTEAESEDDTEVTPSEEENFEAETEDESEEVADESEESEPESEEADPNSVKLSVDFKGEVRTFEASLSEKMQALYELVNDTYGEADNEWYGIDVYEESKTVVMYGYFQGRNFRQSYSVKKDVYSLKGDRVQVYARYLTEDEISQLDSMKQSYAETTERLAQYESEPDKIAILESKDYANLEGNEAFEALKVQENHFNLSVEEVKNQCDAMLLEYAKGHKVEFAEKSVETTATMKKKILPETTAKKAGKYGGIFSRKRDV